VELLLRMQKKVIVVCVHIGLNCRHLTGRTEENHRRIPSQFSLFWSLNLPNIEEGFYPLTAKSNDKRLRTQRRNEHYRLLYARDKLSFVSCRHNVDLGILKTGLAGSRLCL
jgi:hypothetical protein